MHMLFTKENSSHRSISVQLFAAHKALQAIRVIDFIVDTDGLLENVFSTSSATTTEKLHEIIFAKKVAVLLKNVVFAQLSIAMMASNATHVAQFPTQSHGMVGVHHSSLAEKAFLRDHPIIIFTIQFALFLK